MKKLSLAFFAAGVLFLSGCNADLGPFQTLLNTCVFAGTCDGDF